MKKLFGLIMILCFWLNSFSTQYYVNSSMGADGNNGTSMATPWRTLAKVNSFAFAAGDHISFQGTFIGQLNANRNGAAGNPIVYNSYGTGQAIISGFATVSAFTNISANIWESTAAISTLPQCNMVLINNINIAQGRTPNTGSYYTTTAVTANTSISSSSLNSSVINYTGAEAVIRKTAWITDRNTITSASGSAINFPSIDTYNSQVGWGFFLENDVRTLDVQGEWYYNPTTKKIRIFSAANPGSNVQVSTVDTLIKTSNRHDITFDNLNIIGSNLISVQVSSQNVTIQNCSFNYSGVDCIWGGQNLATSTGFICQNNTFNHTNNNAILIRSFFTGALIQKNLIKNTGLQEGMLNRVSNSNQFGMGIEARADNVIVQYNEVDSSGYAGIEVFGNSVTVQNNFCNYATMTLADGGNFYTFVGFNGANPLPPYTNMIIRNNIGGNSIGYGLGTTNTGLPQAQTFYLDDATANVTLTGNTAFNAGNSGIYFHNTNTITATGNTLYNNGNGVVWDGSAANARIRTMTFKKNILVAQTTAEQASNPRSAFNQADIQAFGTAASIDSNVYCRPIQDNLTFLTKNAAAFTNQNLAQWVTFSLFDAHSTKSPFAITNVNQLFFAYNPGHHDGILTDSTIILPAGTWIDVYGTTYNTGSVVLPAYTSKILINTGTNIAPTANAGVDKSITLPTTTVSVTGSGTDVDGTIAAYSWTAVPGNPATVTFSAATNPTTNINGLSVAGVYKIKLQVTDNLGLTGVDTMQVTVNSVIPPNQPPVVNAGGNKNITLPTSTVTQVGNATDPDGTIASVIWTEVSGPLTATIVSPTNTTTVINGMLAPGNYQFKLEATDNLGLKGSQTITVIVNAAAPIPPVANAGPDQSITWPINSVNLAGSGTDADGTIVGYSWTKISGASATITNPTSQNTSVTGLDIGVYIFQLTVTDNSGMTGTDNVQITVNVGSASLAYTVLSRVFNNSPQAVGITTTPAGLATSTLYNGVGAVPINVSSNLVNSNITDPHWTSTPISGTYTITPKPGTITVSNLSQPYDGTGKSVSVSTSDPFVTVTTYDGSATLPINAGSHTVITKTNDGNYLVKPDTSIIVITQAIPTLLNWIPVTPLTYPTAIGDGQLNANWSVAGTDTYNPVSGFVPNAGPLTIGDNFVPSSSNYASVSGTTRTITVNQGTTTISVSNTTQFFDGLPKPITASAGQSGTITITYDGSTTVAPSSLGDHQFVVTFSSLNYTASPVSGVLHIISNSADIFITNYSNIVYTGSDMLPTVTTNPAGLPYLITFNGSASPNPKNVGSYIVIVTINDGGVHVGADTVTMTIIKATPVITWPAISDIIFGTALSSTQYNQSANVSGSFVNSPLIGSFLPVGNGQVLSTQFTPSDAANYNVVSVTNTINVTSSSATMAFQTTTFTYDGTPKNATVVTTPANLTGVIITGQPKTNAGSYPIGATLTNNNFTASPISGTLIINKSDNYTLSWATPSPVQQNTILTGSVLNATSTISGTFSYNYPLGYQFQAPGTYIMTATFTPTNNNYNSKTIQISLRVYGNPFLNYFIRHGNTNYLNEPNQ